MWRWRRWSVAEIREYIFNSLHSLVENREIVTKAQIKFALDEENESVSMTVVHFIFSGAMLKRERLGLVLFFREIEKIE